MKNGFTYFPPHVTILLELTVYNLGMHVVCSALIELGGTRSGGGGTCMDNDNLMSTINTKLGSPPVASIGAAVDDACTAFPQHEKIFSIGEQTMAGDDTPRATPGVGRLPPRS